MATYELNFKQPAGALIELSAGDSLRITGSPATTTNECYAYQLSVGGVVLAEVLASGIDPSTGGGPDKTMVIPESVVAHGGAQTRISCLVEQRRRKLTYPQVSEEPLQSRTVVCLVEDGTIDAAAMAESAETQAISARFGAFVQGKSRPALVISARPGKGAKIARVDIYEGQSPGGAWLGGFSDPGGRDSLSHFPIAEQQSAAKAGSVGRLAVVTDTRGRQVSRAVDCQVLAYQPPQLASLSLTRCTAAGATATNGTYIRMIAAGQVQSLKPNGTEMNTCRLAARCRLSDGSGGWMQQEIPGIPGAVGVNLVLSGAIQCQGDKSYAFELLLIDYFGETVRSAGVGQVFRLLNLHPGGRGIALGKYASDAAALDVGMPAKFQGDVSAYGNEFHYGAAYHYNAEYFNGPLRATGSVAFDCPLDVGSGGTGVRSLAELKGALGLSDLPVMQFGRVAPAVPANAAPVIYALTYPKAFAAAPRSILLTMETPSASYSHQITYSIYSSGPAYFQFALRNSSATPRDVILNWLAIQ